MQTIGFGGGCHWCTEAVFVALKGVETVKQGFISSVMPDESYSEAVEISFDPEVIPLEALTEIHLRTHASMSNHKMRGKYRSAIYTVSDAQADEVRSILDELAPKFEAPLVTRVLPLVAFRGSDPRFQNYAEKNADGPFCQRYIDPKLDLLRAEYADFVTKEKITAS